MTESDRQRLRDYFDEVLAMSAADDFAARSHAYAQTILYCRELFAPDVRGLGIFATKSALGPERMAWLRHATE